MAATAPGRTSLNWSGCAVSQSGTTFTDADGTWVQPTATCSTRKKTHSRFWVGIDGYNSSPVEQTGEADRTGRSTSKCHAWYEMHPALPVSLSISAHPGDACSAEVSVGDPAWTYDAITMAKRNTVKAQPSGLSPDGTAFSVTWFHS